LIERFFNPDFTYTGRSSNTGVPDINVKTTDDAFLIEVAAPGMEKDDFEIDYEKEQLTISTNLEEKNQEEEVYLRREYGYNSFERTFHIPERLVNAEGIKAKYENGIFYIIVSKSEEIKPKLARKIKIS
jgi:HSP20 family protein